MAELYLGDALRRACIERVVPVAGKGVTDLIRAALGPLANGRPKLVVALAHLAPCPICGAVTDTEVTVALGEIGDIWDRSIAGPVMVALMEDRHRYPAMA